MPGVLVIRGVAKLDDVPLSVVDVRRHQDDPYRGEATIVFALLGGRHVLSEIWLSGNRGFSVESPDTSLRVELDDRPDPIMTADARAPKRR
jgi:hypothetical protein